MSVTVGASILNPSTSKLTFVVFKPVIANDIHAVKVLLITIAF